MNSTLPRAARHCAVAATVTLLSLVAASPAPASAPPADYTKTAGLSQPEHETERKTFQVPMTDGIELYVEVVKPKGAGRYPVILEASPYHGTVADRDGTRIFPDPRAADGETMLGLTGYFAPRGYAVVMVDLRGTGRSEGCLDHLGPADAGDLKTIVEWAATREWSNGRVGMTGHSYVGSTPVVAAAQRPKGLVTIAPSAGLASMYDHQFQLGVPYYLQYIGPMVAYELLAIDRHLPPGGEDPVTGGATGDNFANDPEYTGCGLPNSAATAGTGQVTGQYQAWHRARDWREGGAEADIPIFMIHGVNDNAARIPAAEWFFKNRYERDLPEAAAGEAATKKKAKKRRGCNARSKRRGKSKSDARARNKAGKRRKARARGHARRCARAKKRRREARVGRVGPVTPAPARVRDKVWLGQWDHGSAGSSSRCAEESDREGHPNCRFDQWQFALHAWFDRHLKQADVDTGPAVEVFLNGDRVHTDTRWRPADAPLALHASGADRLSPSASDEDGAASFTAAPVWGPGNYVDFVGDVATEQTTFVGVPEMRLTASATGPVQLVATLYEQDSTGALDLSNPITVCAVQPLLRDGMGKTTPVTPGEPMKLEPQCFTAAHVLDAGKRLVLRVSAPHRHTGSHHAPTLAADPRVTVLTGGGATRITVPRAPGAELHADVPKKVE